jgi:hypothetical protein
MIDLHSATFIGIDLRAVRRSYTYAALDENQKLIAFGQGRLDDIFAFISGCQSAICAINSPLTTGPTENSKPDFTQDALFPIEQRKGQKHPHRQAEHDLLLRGIMIPKAPSSLEMNGSPGWIRRGFQFIQLLEQVGFKVWPSEGSTRQYIEVQAEAAYWNWLGAQPLNEETLEGRIQRQLILAEMDIDVPDPMTFFEEVTRYKLLRGLLPMKGIYSPQELNAIVCAVTALLLVKKPQQVASFGNLADGIIYLPTHELNTR